MSRPRSCSPTTTGQSCAASNGVAPAGRGRGSLAWLSSGAGCSVSPLHAACASGNTETVDLLVRPLVLRRPIGDMRWSGRTRMPCAASARAAGSAWHLSPQRTLPSMAAAPSRVLSSARHRTECLGVGIDRSRMRRAGTKRCHFLHSRPQLCLRISVVGSASGSA
jgi:hypothetical protein